MSRETELSEARRVAGELARALELIAPHTQNMADVKRRALDRFHAAQSRWWSR